MTELMKSLPIAGYAPRTKTGEFAAIKANRDSTFRVVSTDRPDVWSEREQLLFGMITRLQGHDPEVTWAPMYDNRLLNGPTYILKTETGGVYNPATGWTPKEIAPESILFAWEVDDLKAKLGDDLAGLTVCTYSKLEAVAPLYAAVPGEEDDVEPADCIEEADTFSVDVLLRFPFTGDDDVLVTEYEERDVDRDEIEDAVNGVTQNFPAAEIDADLLGALETLGTPGPRF